MSNLSQDNNTIPSDKKFQDSIEYSDQEFEKLDRDTQELCDTLDNIDNIAAAARVLKDNNFPKDNNNLPRNSNLLGTYAMAVSLKIEEKVIPGLGKICVHA